MFCTHCSNTVSFKMRKVAIWLAYFKADYIAFGIGFVVDIYQSLNYKFKAQLTGERIFTRESI